MRGWRTHRMEKITLERADFIFAHYCHCWKSSLHSSHTRIIAVPLVGLRPLPIARTALASCAPSHPTHHNGKQHAAHVFPSPLALAPAPHGRPAASPAIEPPPPLVDQRRRLLPLQPQEASCLSRECGRRLSLTDKIRYVFG
jgi:hypothetical protein